MQGEIPVRLTVAATGHVVPVDLVAVDRAELERLQAMEQRAKLISAPSAAMSGTQSPAQAARTANYILTGDG